MAFVKMTGRNKKEIKKRMWVSLSKTIHSSPSGTWDVSSSSPSMGGLKYLFTF